MAMHATSAIEAEEYQEGQPQPEKQLLAHVMSFVLFHIHVTSAKEGEEYHEGQPQPTTQLLAHVMKACDEACHRNEHGRGAERRPASAQKSKVVSYLSVQLVTKHASLARAGQMYQEGQSEPCSETHVASAS